MKKLPKHAFWDIDVDSLCREKDKEFIISRVMMTANKDNFDSVIKELESIYTDKEIYLALKHTKERISNNVCRLVCDRYQMPKFLRYKPVLSELKKELKKITDKYPTKKFKSLAFCGRQVEDVYVRFTCDEKTCGICRGIDKKLHKILS